MASYIYFAMDVVSLLFLVIYVFLCARFDHEMSGFVGIESE